MPEPFAVKDCALIAIGTGERAQNLRELRDRLLTTHPACIYHHFWGGCCVLCLMIPNIRMNLPAGPGTGFMMPAWPRNSP